MTWNMVRERIIGDMLTILAVVSMVLVELFALQSAGNSSEVKSH